MNVQSAFLCACVLSCNIVFFHISGYISVYIGATLTSGRVEGVPASRGTATGGRAAFK